jgi:uncharacterized membrane protein
MVLAFASAGDTVVVCTLDRLGPTREDVLGVLATLNAKGIHLMSLRDGFEFSGAGGTGEAATVSMRNFDALMAVHSIAPTQDSPARQGQWRALLRLPRLTWRGTVIALAAVLGVMLLYVLCFSLAPSYDRYTGRVTATRTLDVQDNYVRQELTILVTSGDRQGRQYTLPHSSPVGFESLAYAAGDSVLLGMNAATGEIFLDTYDRRGPIFALLLLFLLAIVLVARRQGVMAIVGMAVSLAIVFLFIAPNVLQGRDPALFAVLAACVIIPTTYYLAHGFGRKTTVAIIATFATLTATFALAAAFAGIMRVPVVVSVDDGTLFYGLGGGMVNPRSLYLAGLVIGGLAILNDITISQASIVESLARSNPALGIQGLFAHAMSVGRDHVASLVNTIVLVYVGASFPLFLTVVGAVSTRSFGLSDPYFATDLLRTVAVSIGIVVAVPVSTAIAAYASIRSRGHLHSALSK